MPKDSLVYTEANAVPAVDEAREAKPESWQPSEQDKNGLPSEKWVQDTLLRRIENEMETSQASFHQEWDDAKTIYEAYVKPEENKPNLKAPLSHMVIDSAMAEEIDAFQDIEYETQQDEDRAKLPILNASKKYALARANWDFVKIDARRICRIYGLCPVRVSYVQEVRKIKERIPMKGDDGWAIAYKEKWDYPWQDIRLDVIDHPKRFLVDNHARDIRSAADCALRTVVSWESFKQKVQHNRFFRNLKYVKPGVVWNIDMNLEGKDVFPQQERSVSEGDDVELLEYWNKDLDLYIMWANRVIIRIGGLPDDHKELPFAVLHLHRRPHTFYSKGIPKLIESIEAAYNKLLNATVQATGLAFPIIATSEDAGIDARAMAAYPGHIFEGALDKMRLEQLGSVPAEVWKTKEELEKLIVWITGVNYQQIFGELSERVGIEALKKESMLSRINANLREQEADFVVRIGDLIAQNIMQYYPLKKVRALTSQDDLSKVPEEDKVYDGPIVRGILEHRKIPITGTIRYDEEKTEKGYKITPHMNDDGENSFIVARPDYIRTKSKLDVRAIRPSAMGSSREAKKIMFAELLNTALDVNGAVAQQGTSVDPKTGAPIPGKPVWNIEYLSKRLAEAHELPIDKVIMNGDENKGREASSELAELGEKLTADFKQPLEEQVKKKLTGPGNDLGGAMPIEAGQAQPPMGGGQLPPNEQGAYAANV